MYEEQLFATVPSRSLLSRGPSTGSRNLGEFGGALGSPLLPSGAAGRAVAPAAPESPRFLMEGLSMESPPAPPSLALLALVAGVRRNHCPSDPRSPWAGPGLGRRDPRRARARAAVEARRSGGLVCGGGAARPARRLGPGARWLSGAGPRSPRGDGAPVRALFGSPDTLRTSFQPPGRRPPASAPALFVFPAPRSPRGHANSPRGRVRFPRRWSKAGPSPAGASTASSGPAASRARGRGNSGAFLELRGRGRADRGRGLMECTG